MRDRWAFRTKSRRPRYFNRMVSQLADAVKSAFGYGPVSDEAAKTSSTSATIIEYSKISYQFIAKFLTEFFSRESVKNYLFAVSKQGWVGLTRIAHFTSTTILFDKPETRKILVRSSKINGAKLGLIIANGVTLEALIDYVSKSDSAYRSFTLFPLYRMSNLLQVFSYSQTTKLLYENMMLNVSSSTIITKENPDVINEHYKSCGHDAGAILSAGIESVKEYYFALGLLKALSCIPGMYYPCLFAEIFVNGRSMAELKLAAVGTCAVDRTNILKELNAFSTGIGLSFEGVTFLACNIIESMTGIPRSETRSVVQSILYPYFAAAVVLMKEPIPPFDENPKPAPSGRDLMWLSRYIQSGVISVVRWGLGIKTEEEKRAEEEAKRKVEAEAEEKKKQDEEQKETKATGVKLPLASMKKLVAKVMDKKDKEREQDKKTRKDSVAKPVDVKPGEVKQGENQVEPIAPANSNVPELQPTQEPIDKARLKALLEYAQAARLYVNEKTEKYPFFAFLKYVITFDLFNDWTSLEAFLSNHENKIFFSTYYAVTLQQLEGIKDLREKRFKDQTWAEALKGAAARIIPGLPDWLSRFLVSDEYKAMLKFLLSDEFKDPLDNVIKVLKEMYEIHRLAIEKDEQTRLKAIKTHDLEALAKVIAELTAVEEARKLAEAEKAKKIAEAEKAKREAEVTYEKTPDLAGLEHAMATPMFATKVVSPPSRKMTIGENANVVVHDEYIPAAAATSPKSSLRTSGEEIAQQRDHVSASALKASGFMRSLSLPQSPVSDNDAQLENDAGNDDRENHSFLRQSS